MCVVPRQKDRWQQQPVLLYKLFLVLFKEIVMSRADTGWRRRLYSNMQQRFLGHCTHTLHSLIGSSSNLHSKSFMEYTVVEWHCGPCSKFGGLLRWLFFGLVRYLLVPPCRPLPIKGSSAPSVQLAASGPLLGIGLSLTQGVSLSSA